VPALLLHSAISTFAVTWVLNFAAQAFWINYLIGQWTWTSAVFYYIGGLAAGTVWSRRLDRLLFNTSRWVWVLPILWFSFYFSRFALGSLRFAIALFFAPRVSWFFIGGVVQILVSAGYGVGAWIRRSTGDEIPNAVEASIGPSAWPETRRSLWAKTVKLWRAGRSIDYPDEEPSSAADERRF